MKSPGGEDLDSRFAEAWKKWTRRPPQKSPAAAAAEVAYRIRHRPSAQHQSWYLAAAAAMLLLLVGTTVLWKPWRIAPAPRPASFQETIPMGKGEVLIWLDEQTPLYMTFQAPEDEEGKEGKS